MDPNQKLVISQGLAQTLRDQGWTQERIDEQYVVDDSLVELERQERNARIDMNRRKGDYQKYQPNRAKRRKKR